MKSLIRLFFKMIRLILGPILLLAEWITTPRSVVRTAADQRAVDQATGMLTLYQFRTCPFCIKVRRTCKRLSLPIATRDAQHDAIARQELLAATGKVQVPCLKIAAADGTAVWMPESGAIIQYLHERFAGQGPRKC
jgi:glutaredoxin